MLTYKSYNSFESTLESANALTSLESLYSTFKSHFGKIFLLFNVYLFLWPLLLLFAYWLKRQRKYFQRTMRLSNGEFKTSKDYSEFRKKFDKLKELSPKLKKVQSYKKDKAPLVLKFVLSQMQKTSSTLLTYESWMENRLSKYNKKMRPKINNTTVFTFQSESKLWESRNHNYEYWM